MKNLLITLWLIASTLAYAHGDKPHGKPTVPVAKEQKDWGIAGDKKDAKRTITIKMTDNMRFSPDKIDVQLGETVRFVIENQGKLLHEMVIGTKKELDAHAQMMLKHPNMEHDEPYMAHVAAGKKGEMIWTFNRAGEFDFACLIAGHYQAGMAGKITVSTKKAEASQSKSNAGFSLFSAAHAQTQTQSPAAASASSAVEWTKAEVRRVDAATRRLTLKHEHIKHLDMPPMSMVFAVRDGIDMSTLQVGQALRVKAEHVGGKFMVTAIEP